MGHRLRVTVLISGNGSNLQALIDAQEEQNFTIVGVISNCADAFGLIRAEKAGITTHTVSQKNYPDRADFDHALIQLIDKMDTELVVLAGFMRILTPVFTQHYQGRLTNIHPSLLLKYKGLHTHKRVLEAGESEHGSAVHFVTAKVDEGAIIIQAKTPIEPEDTEDSLITRIRMLEHQIYPIAVGWFASKRLQYKNQQAWLDEQPLPTMGYQFTSPQAKLKNKESI